MSETLVPATPTILAQAQRALADSLAVLPPDRRGALAAVVTTEGARVAFVEKLNDTWAVSAYAAKPWDGPLEAGATILGTWR
jgi:hypothetical protein